jgi:MtN3 and saliva related transmembrane protein
MPWIDLVGLFGAFLTSITFIPQVYKAWQTRSVGDLSTWTVLIVIISAIVWLVYALYLRLMPVIIANSIILVLAVLLLYFKLSFKK